MEVVGFFSQQMWKELRWMVEFLCWWMAEVEGREEEERTKAEEMEVVREIWEGNKLEMEMDQNNSNVLSH